MTSLARPAALCLAVLSLVAVGCGSDSKDNEAASTKPSSPPAVSTTTSDCQPLAGGATTPQQSSANENRETMYLTGVESEAEHCDARVTFEFEEAAPGPGYVVSYQPASSAKIEDGSGNLIDVSGEAFLVVKLSPAMTAKIDGDQVTKTYTGPRRLSGSAPVQEVVKTGDFEGVVTWVIGLDRERPFTTQATDSRLVVEIDGS